MVNTIRIDNGNFKSLQNKLPKCNYNNEKEKQNENSSNRILENFSYVSKAKGEKLPQIKRPDSASKCQ